MKIIINNSSMQPLYDQITEQIKCGVMQGTLKEGENLPSVRTLAKELRISALTVKSHMTFWNRRVLLSLFMEKEALLLMPARNLCWKKRKKRLRPNWSRRSVRAEAAE